MKLAVLLSLFIAVGYCAVCVYKDTTTGNVYDLTPLMNSTYDYVVDADQTYDVHFL